MQSADPRSAYRDYRDWEDDQLGRYEDQLAADAPAPVVAADTSDLMTIDGEEIHLLNPWMKSVLDEEEWHS